MHPVNASAHDRTSFIVAFGPGIETERRRLDLLALGIRHPRHPRLTMKSTVSGEPKFLISVLRKFFGTGRFSQPPSSTG